jgi:hypothetical protein
MLKSISAAVLAVSMIAAPALATGAPKTPVSGKTAQIPASGQPDKARALNANAKMHRHHRHHHHVSAVKGHSKVSLRHAAIAAKRG